MPRPVLQAMVLADHVYQDRLSGKYIIAGTFGRIGLRAPQAQAAQPAAPPAANSGQPSASPAASALAHDQFGTAPIQVGPGLPAAAPAQASPGETKPPPAAETKPPERTTQSLD